MSVTETSVGERMSQNQTVEDVYDDGYLRVEHENYYASCGGRAMKLPRTEFLIFSRLTRTPDRIVKAEELWAHVWGTDKPLNTESLHVYMYRLRAKLSTHGLQIETMVNVGYRLLRSVQSSPTLTDASLQSHRTPAASQED
jgi:two-component system alkaline phosphatase synthesis response regulator PhoP